MIGVMIMPNWLINFFAGLGMLETALLVVSGIIIYADIKRVDQEED